MNSSDRIHAVFEKRFPAIVSRLDGATASDGEADYRGQSADWPALLNRWLDGLELREGVAYALTGFGDGSHVAALLGRLPRGSYVFCAESDASVFRGEAIGESVLEVLEDPRFFLGMGRLDEDFFESLSRFPTLELTDARPLIFAPIFNGDPDYWNSFFTEFTRSYEYWRKLYGTNVTASGRWQRNTLANAGILIPAPDISEASGLFKGKPIILVSAGPSLDTSLEFVKGRQETSVIVAVNSSYRALRNAGVVPHFVIAADPYEYTERGFEGVETDGTVLICPFIVYPKVAQRFRGRAFTWSRNNLLASYLRLLTGRALGSEVVEIGTVSACIFDIAKIFGSGTIVFVGQDLAAGSDGQLHAKDSFYEDSGTNYLGSAPCREMPGNVDATVQVDEKLFVYLKTFESLAALHGTELDLYNTSRLGARIEGIPYLLLEDAERMLDQLDRSGVESGMNAVWKILGNQVKRDEKLDATLDTLSQKGRAVCTAALKAAMALESALAQGADPGSETLEAAEAQRVALDELLASDSDFEKVLSDGSLKYERMLENRAVGKIAAEASPERRRGETLLNGFWAIAEGVYAFLQGIEASRCADES